MAGKNVVDQQQLQDTAMNMVGVAAKLPVVRVDREQFLRQQFGDSPHLDHILEHGPQVVYAPESLRKKRTRLSRATPPRQRQCPSFQDFPATLW